MEKDIKTSFSYNSAHYESVVTKAINNATFPQISSLEDKMHSINSAMKLRESLVERKIGSTILPQISSLEDKMHSINSAMKLHESLVERKIGSTILPQISSLENKMHSINSAMKLHESLVERKIGSTILPQISSLENKMHSINSAMKLHESLVERKIGSTILPQISSLEDKMHSINSAMKLHESLVERKIGSTIFPHLGAIDGQLNNIKKLLRNEDWTQITSEISKQITQPNFYPTLTDISIAAQHIEKQIDETVIPAYDKSTPKDVNIALVQAIEKLTTQIANIQTISDGSESTLLSNASKIIIRCVLDLIASAMIGFLFLPIPTNPPAYEHKAMLNAARTYVSNQTTINSVRIVKVNGSLNVRLRPNKKSRIIGSLPRLAVVFQKDKTKKWSLIHYVEREGKCELIGWVYSKYLCKGK